MRYAVLAVLAALLLAAPAAAQTVTTLTGPSSSIIARADADYGATDQAADMSLGSARGWQRAICKLTTGTVTGDTLTLVVQIFNEAEQAFESCETSAAIGTGANACVALSSAGAPLTTQDQCTTSVECEWPLGARHRWLVDHGASATVANYSLWCSYSPR